MNRTNGTTHTTRTTGRMSPELEAIHDAIQRLAAVSQQPPEPQSSVQIEQAAKPGQPPRITVKVYAPMPAAAADMAQQLYDALVARYGANPQEH